jgi:hypothetical protein
METANKPQRRGPRFNGRDLFRIMRVVSQDPRFNVTAFAVDPRTGVIEVKVKQVTEQRSAAI